VEEEPTKVEKAQKPAAPEPKSSGKLASIIDGWDD
jgi:hypothetical protein